MTTFGGQTKTAELLYLQRAPQLLTIQVYWHDASN